MLLTESQHEKWGEGGCQATTPRTPPGEAQIVPTVGREPEADGAISNLVPKVQVALLRVVLLRDM